jgi:hypothetical protein
MELEDYSTAFRDNDEQVELLEHFWCAKCDKTLTHVILYTKEKEWTEDEETEN